MKGDADLRLEIMGEGFSDFMTQRDSLLEQCWLISIATDELFTNGKTVVMPMKKYDHRRLAGVIKQRGKHRSILGRGDLEGETSYAACSTCFLSGASMSGKPGPVHLS
ncbi:MAG: hypothetical protein KAJ55_09140 [Anaerolineales bacterium]|nr:hypothetical protein [Anaerolineales bacterium]